MHTNNQKPSDIIKMKAASHISCQGYEIIKYEIPDLINAILQFLDEEYEKSQQPTYD